MQQSIRYHFSYNIRHCLPLYPFFCLVFTAQQARKRKPEGAKREPSPAHCAPITTYPFPTLLLFPFHLRPKSAGVHKSHLAILYTCFASRTSSSARLLRARPPARTGAKPSSPMSLAPANIQQPGKARQGTNAHISPIGLANTVTVPVALSGPHCTSRAR